VKPTGGSAQPAKPVTSNFKSLEAVRTAMLKKLEDSDLTAADVAKLKLEPLTAQSVADKLTDLTFHRAGFKIPYFHPDGKQNRFYRFRYLEYDNGRGLAKLVHQPTNGNGLAKPNKHDIRYVQPAATLPQVYLPPNAKKLWKQVLDDASIPLVITEGELKAACACKHGLFCIGLGGVWSWKSKHAGMHILPMLAEIKMEWEAKNKTSGSLETQPREVMIVFDSDSASNIDVHMAENALAHELTQLGAKVRILRMPAVDGEKTGLDDYIVKTHDTALANIPKEEWGEAKELFKLNEEVVYVEDPGLVIRLDTLQRMAPGAFGDHHYANRIWRHQNAAGNIVVKQAAKEWIKWPMRAEVSRTVYLPGEPRAASRTELNVWPGWGSDGRLVAAKGDITLWNELMQFLFADHADSAFRIQWFEWWLAYPLLHPGTKMNQAVGMWSTEQGTGKSLIGYIMQEIYGLNFVEIGDRHIRGDFNEWAENRQFVMGDEITSVHERKRDIAERLKSTITQKDIRINRKYIPAYFLKDVLNYYFTSNHQDAFYLEDTDRRLFINEIKRKPREKAFYDKVAGYFLKTKDGPAALFYHFLHDVDGDFYKPTDPAPSTTSKLAMTKAAASGATEQFVHDLRADRLGTLTRGMHNAQRTLYTASELADIGNYDKSEDEMRNPHSRVDAQLLGRLLGSVKFRQVCNGVPIHIPGRVGGSQTTARLWAIVDLDKSELYDQLTTSQASIIRKWEKGKLGMVTDAEVVLLPQWYIYGWEQLVERQNFILNTGKRNGK
jgi:hypothetical protein